MNQTIGKVCPSQGCMRTLVLVMFTFLHLDIALCILHFTSVYCEYTPPSLIAAKLKFLSFEGWGPDSVLLFLSKSLEKQTAGLSGDTQYLCELFFCLRSSGRNRSYSLLLSNMEHGSER